MSHTHDIDNEGAVFHFDQCEGPSVAPASPLSTTPLLRNANILDPHSRIMPYYPDPPSSERSNEQENNLLELGEKGKGVTMPVPIQVSAAPVHDHFDMSPSGSMFPASHDSHFSPSSNNCISTHDDLLQHFTASITKESIGSVIGALSSCEGGTFLCKGKRIEKDTPPTLPPLTFTPTGFGYEQSSWPLPELISPTPGPSSYESTSERVLTTNHRESRNVDGGTSSVPATQPTHHTNQPVSSFLRRMPSRRRSLSNMSIHSTRSLAAQSMSKIKVKFGQPRTPNNLARKLLFRKRQDPPEHPSHSEDPEPVQLINSRNLDANSLSRSTPWRTDSKFDNLESQTTQFSHLGLQDVNSQSSIYVIHPAFSKGQGRSNSSPFPLSALDYVPIPATDIYAPIPLVRKNYFDQVLPQELRIKVLTFLIAIHESEHLRTVTEGRWTVTKASSSRNQWVGRDKGAMELVRLSRVSKSWQMLVFDGQLWVDISLRSFPKMLGPLLLRLTATSGPFSTSLDVAGHVHLPPTTLTHITDNLCLTADPQSILPYTQLTAINLQGCTALKTRSLHHLLTHSRALQKLCLKGLGAVTNSTCGIISAQCPCLISLDLSRCPNMDAEGIRCLATAAMTRGDHLLLKELRLSGLKHINDSTMAALGQAAPYLEVLDLNYVRQLHNSALGAFVTCENDEAEEDLGVKTVLLSAREVGLDPNDSNKYRRRITNLRHISLSFCVLLTDDACSNLAHSVPRLEFFEMAGIGADLKDDGLVRLLNTTPLIRRLDLEDASEITDMVIATLTPAQEVPVEPLQPTDSKPGPGHALEQLNISYAINITDDALLALICGCTRLRGLEMDNTRIGSTVLKEFVRLSRQRKTIDARIVAIDCRGITESLVKELSASTRPRKGLRTYQARKHMYLDGRDGNVDDLKVGQDECDEKRVVLKTFYSWQSVDAVRSAREKRRKSTSRRLSNELSGSASDLERATRWWSPGGRRSPGSTGRDSPLNLADLRNDGCRIM